MCESCKDPAGNHCERSGLFPGCGMRCCDGSKKVKIGNDEFCMPVCENSGDCRNTESLSYWQKEKDEICLEAMYADGPPIAVISSIIDTPPRNNFTYFKIWILILYVTFLSHFELIMRSVDN